MLALCIVELTVYVINCTILHIGEKVIYKSSVYRTKSIVVPLLHIGEKVIYKSSIKQKV